MTEHADRIVVEPGRRSGRAVVRGTRIAVADILSLLAAGMTTDEVLADFPSSSGPTWRRRCCMPRRWKA